MVPHRETHECVFDALDEEMIPIGTPARKCGQTLMSIYTKAPTTIDSRTAFQTSILERGGVDFQRLLASSPTRTTGTNVETVTKNNRYC